MLKPMLSAASRPGFHWNCLLVFAFLAAAPLSTGVSLAQQEPAAPPFSIPDASTMGPGRGRNPRDDDPAARLLMEKRIKELNILRQKQLTSDAAKLLVLASELNATLDKKPQQSREESSAPDLMRKAEQIEKLAHSVRVKMTDAASN